MPRGIGGIAEGMREVFQDAQGVVPERLDFHGLADAWSDYPVPDLGVHPGQLHAGLACMEQAIGLDLNLMPGTAHKAGHDLFQFRVEILAHEVRFA